MTKKLSIYQVSDEIDYQMLERREIIGKKIVDFDLLQDPIEGDELIIFLDDGKQIEISLLLSGKILVQSD